MDNSGDFSNPDQPSWDANQTLPVLRPPRQEASEEPTKGKFFYPNIKFLA